MKLKIKLDEAPGDDIKDFYIEKDGVWWLDVEGVTEHPQVAGLKTALEKEKKDAKAIKTERDELKVKVEALPEGFTQEEWDRLQALDGIDPNDPQAKEKRKQQQDERLQRQRDQYEQQITNLKTTKDAEIAALKVETDNLKAARARDQAALALDKAMDEANIDPKFRDGVRALHVSKIKHDIDGENISLFVETDLGNADVSSYIDTWSKSDAGKVYVSVPKGPDPKGGNQQGGSGSNPFLAVSWNKTEQAALRANPAHMNRLAQQAGFASGDVALAATKALK